MAKKKKADTRHLMHGVCPLNAVPVRFKPDESFPFLSQLLFGETCHILEKKNKHWFKVFSEQSQVTGWIQAMQIQLIEEKQFIEYNNNFGIALEVCSPVMSDEISMPVVLGSSLPNFDGISCQLGQTSFVYNGQAVKTGELEWNPELFIKLAKRYLHSPEMSGGRTPFGIDSPALVQQLYAFFHLTLPRFSSDQFPLGEIVDFVELAQPGDIAFFHDQDDRIHHCGLVIGPKKILHSFGQGRIDKLDHHGIFHTGLLKYTHKLRVIKRMAVTQMP